MKPTTFFSIPPSPRRQRRGFALILVLACLVLLTVVILAFLVSTGSELASSKFYANASSTRLLAQSATDLVMGEIRDATYNGALCWASQPGMIRTWDNTGAPQSFYKLYSDSSMVEAGSNYTAPTIPSSWYSQQGLYVDLNQPIQTNVGGTTSYAYPILDGNSSDLISTGIASAAGVPSGAQVIGPLVGSGPYQNYPQVSGFWLNSAPVDPSSLNQAPMPVKWLYVLKDGEIAVPSSVASGVVSFYGADPVTGLALPVPSTTNPITGRMAFWTDDETCKVNVNTAGESVTSAGTSAVWDIPREYTTPEQILSWCQPAQNEFQRYPGHPATVSLSTVFGSLTTDVNFPECIYPLTPRLTGSTVLTSPAAPTTNFGTFNAGTGSKEGTLKASNAPSYAPTITTGQTTTGVSGAPLTGALALSTRRLYATPDELLFSIAQNTTTSVRYLNNVSFANSATPSFPFPNTTALTASTELDPTLLRKTDFFLTASSRAPDVNLFNQPRISMWPISSNTATTYRTPNDQLIAFCTTVNGFPYYFQRDPTTNTTGANDQYDDLANITRNRSVLEYLRYLTKQPIPGFGGTFGGASGKYGAKDVLSEDAALTGYECDQILTEIFDYIRSTNTYDQSTGSTTFIPYTGGITGLMPDGKYGSGLPEPYNPGMGQVVPIIDKTNGTRGFGRFPTLHSAALIFFTTQNDGSGSISATGGTPPLTTQMQAVFAMQLFDPSMGYPVNDPWLNVQVSGLDGLKWPDGSAMFAGGTLTVGNPYGGVFSATAWPFIGGVMDFRRLLLNAYTGSVGSDTGTTTYSAYNPGTTGAYTTTSAANTGTLFSKPYPATAMSGTSASSTLQPGGASSTASFTLNTPTAPITVTLSSNNLDNTGTVHQQVQQIKLIFAGGTCVIPSASTHGGMDTSLSFTADHVPSSTGSGTPNAAPSGWELWANRFQDVQDALNPFYPSNGYPYAGNFMSYDDSTHGVVSTTGDFRLLAARANVAPSGTTDAFFMAHPAHNPTYNTTATTSPVRFAHEFEESGGGVAMHGSSAWVSGAGVGGTFIPYSYISGNPYFGMGSAEPMQNNEYSGYGQNYNYASDVPTQAGVFAGGSGTVPGDWDNGVANLKDGAYINKADEGNTGSWGNATAYFDVTNFTATGSTFFSPNRMVPSAGMLGSLPTGVLENKPWQTLLFRPGPSGHPGLGTPPFSSSTSIAMPPYTQPPDHLFLDFFTMPVVEPYAISEPLSTAGRINMNYQIVPFGSYITRRTGMEAALRSVSVMAMTNASANKYKYQTYGSAVGTLTLPDRFGVDVNATLSQFNARFTAGDIFHAPSEICSVDLVPTDYTAEGGLTSSPGTLTWRQNLDSYWSNGGGTVIGHALTGDNTRERPYANLYPLLTTKSNTFTIHFRVQTLKPVSGNGNPATWREGTDVITGEYRGSQTIERYIDPNESDLPDFTASPSTTQTLAPYYKFRVVSTRQFSP